MGYKTPLKANELEIINYISTREEKRRTLQSIYQYVIKHATLNNGQFIISNKDFHKMYSRYHTKMKADTFRKYLDLLTKFGLVIKNKFKNVNMFSVNRNIKFNYNIFFTDKKPTFVPAFVPTQNFNQTVDITELKGNQDLPNTKYKLINIFKNKKILAYKIYNLKYILYKLILKIGLYRNFNLKKQMWLLLWYIYKVLI